ncbi:DUF5684 domain-containing protein [Agathobacter rectalis]|uniref:DUF5684 domain-containing protein n=1 Tax=Agathobacter rectalis TaxID=39491 RepID=UPI003FD7FCB5
MNFYYSLSNTNEVREVINLAVFVLTIVASWILYNKAGEPGWAAIIPFYSSYIRFKVAGKKKLFWGYLAASIVTIASFILLCYELVVSGMFMFASAYSRSYYDSMYGYSSSLSTHMAMMIFSIVIFFSALIVMAVLNIMCCIGLSHAFGKGAGFACGLIFLNVIFICIIAFNKNIVYVGDGYNSNNNYYNPYGSNGYGQQYGQNMYGNGANQQYGQNMYGNGAGNQQYGQNMYGTPGANGAGNQQYGQNMYGTPGTNGAGNQQYGQNMYGAPGTNGAGNQQYGQNMYGTSGTNGYNQQYGQNDYDETQILSGKNSSASSGQSWNDEYNNKDYE